MVASSGSVSDLEISAALDVSADLNCKQRFGAVESYAQSATKKKKVAMDADKAFSTGSRIANSAKVKPMPGSS